MGLAAGQGDMTQNAMTGPVFLGATGKLGRALACLHRAGHLSAFSSPIWQYRSGSPAPQGDTLAWDILSVPPPALRPSAVVVLAGVTHGTQAELAQNTALALAACDWADQAGGVPVLLTSSQAVYGPQSGLLSEDTACAPDTPYGQAKLAMEQAVAGRANVTCLRIGNVVGCDAISGAMARGPVTLHRFADGTSPRRAMIGPQTLGAVLHGLLAQAGSLPPVLNVAAPGLVAMSDLLTAAGLGWTWQDAPPTALPALDLDLSHLQSLVPLPAADPVDLVAQAQLAGWSPAQ